MNYYNKLIAFVLVFLFVSGNLSGQKKYEKHLQKADIKYEYGDYKKAIKFLKKFKSKINHLGTENKYTPTYYLREARFYWAYGIVVGFENSLSNAIESSKRVDTDTSSTFVRVKLEVAEIYMLYGNYVAARTHVDDARKIIEEFHSDKTELIAKAELYMAMILSHQGYYQQALTYINEREEYFKKRLVEKEDVTNKNGKTKTIRLTEKEVLQRYSDYARLRSYKARTLGDMGALEEAWNEYENTRDWIAGERKFLGSDSYEYIENQIAFAEFLVGSGLDADELGRGDFKEEGYGKILSRLEKSHSDGHYLAFGIYESLLTQYLVDRKQTKYRNLRISYERSIEKNFLRTSLHQINLDKIEFNSRIDRDKTKNLEDRANSILSNIQTLPRNHKTSIDVLQFLYRVAVKERQFNKAEEHLKTIIEIQQSLFGKESPKMHLAQVKLANFYVDYTNKITEANEIYDNSFYTILQNEIKPFHEDYLTILTHLAALREYQDNYGEARQILEEAERIALQKFSNKTDIEYLKILEQVAKLQINMGEYKEGEKNITYVMDSYDDLKIRNDEYLVINLVKAEQTMATLKGIYGLFDDAEDLINESQKRLEDARTLEGYNTFEAKDELSGLYVFLGRLSEAEELLDELIDEYEKIYGANSGKIVPALINKGRLESLLGNYTEAENRAEQAHTIASTVFGETSTKTAATLKLLGEIQINIGDYEQATDYIEAAVRIEEARFGEDHINVALAKSSLGIAMFYNEDDLQEIEELMLEAQKNIERTLSVNNPRYAEVTTNLAKVYIQTEKFDKAFDALTTSEQIWVEITGRRGARRNINVGKVNTLQGDLYYYQRNYLKAEEHYEKARVNFKRSLNDEHPEYVKVLSKLSKVFYMSGNADKAKETMEAAIKSYDSFIKHYFSSLSEREKAKFWNTIKPDFEYYNTLALQYMSRDETAVGTMYNNALMTKALLLNSSIKVRERILNSGNEELVTKFNEWLTKKETMTKVLSMSEEELVANNINPNRLAQDVEDLERELSSQSEEFSNELEEKQVTWQDVRNSLGENEVALEMVRFRYFDHTFTDSVVYAVLYVKNTKEFRRPDVILLRNGEQLEGRQFTYYQSTITNRLPNQISYSMYWEPIVEKLGNLNTFFLSPDGVYNKINLEAIEVEEGKYVIDNSNIILVSNTKDIFLKRNREQTQRNSDSEALMFGNPDFYLAANAAIEWPRLPGTEQEVTQVRKLLANNGFKSDYFTKDEATEEQVKMVNNPAILHIATHGFFTGNKAQKSQQLEITQAESAKNPLLQTGLIMTGGGDVISKSDFNFNIESGVLTAYEAMSLNLDKTDLVVLSACETAQGQLEVGEGVYGLQRAFLVAGARTLIMSLFKVDDTATQELMILFYKKWLESGDKRKAFVDAKKELRNKFPEPYYWGAFIMIGLG